MNKKKTKIIFIADCCESSIQAQNRDAKNWILFLDPLKYDISIFCKGEPDIRLKNKYNVNIIFLNNKIKLIRGFKKVYYYIFKAYEVVIVSNWYLSNILFKINKYLGKSRKLVVPIVNQVPYEDPKFSYFKSGNINIFAISEKIKQGIRNYLNVDVPVVHGCYDLCMFNYKPHHNKRRKIVCVASLQVRKQPFLFANIAKETPEADFIWVGDGYYMSWLEEKIQSEKISNLTMAGTMSQLELSSFLPKCDIFLFPSIHEGFPGAVAEAMACGLPVIVFDTYGPEAVIDGKTGYVVESEFEMLKKLKYLLSNEDTLRDFSVNARKRAMDFEGSSIIHELEDYIDEIVLK